MHANNPCLFFHSLTWKEEGVSEMGGLGLPGLIRQMLDGRGLLELCNQVVQCVCILHFEYIDFL